VHGTERIGWDQAAESLEALAALGYAAYVDGNRVELADSGCAETRGPSGYFCSARMPPLKPGTNVIELVAYRAGSTGIVESARSAPLRVMLVGSTASVQRTPVASDATERGDGFQLTVQTVVDRLEEPTAVAFAPDGWLYIAERPGRVLALASQRPAEVTALAEIATVGEAGLLDLTLHPEYALNRFLYTVSTVEQADGELTYHLTRFRSVNGILGESAVLIDNLPADRNRPSAAIRFGSDRKLYVAVGASEPADSVTYPSGRILRLNDDGTTPPDNPGHSPVWSSGHDIPVGLDWHPEDGQLWEVERIRGGHRSELNRIQAGSDFADLAPAVSESRRMSGTPPVRSFSRTLGVSGARFYRRELFREFYGDLLVSALDGRDLVRVRFDGGNPGRLAATEPLLQGRLGRIRGIEVGPDGALYVFTGNREPGAPPQRNDRLVRLVPR
jgi:glucose/arabinose dehydrogenase